MSDDKDNVKPGETGGQNDDRPGNPEETEQDKALRKDRIRKSVKEKCGRVKKAKKHFEADFKRMRKNMEFTYGIQSDAQDNMDSEDYRANWTNREVNQKVAALYARDPKALYRRRKRMDFQIWDGDPVTRMAAMAAMQQGTMMGQPPNPQAMMLLQDIDQGEQWQKMCDRVGATLEKLYEYQCDTQAPDFKYQMKQLVRRAVITGVGFVRLNFSRLGDSALTSTGTDDSLSLRVKKLKYLTEQLEKDKIQKDDARVYEMQQLSQSIVSSVQQGDMTNVEERLEFDFPSSTSIIVDPRCQSLKGFVGARWIVQQYVVPLEFVNEYFEKNLGKEGEDYQVYKEDGVEQPQVTTAESKDDPEAKPLVCLWEYFDLGTKSYCFLVDGYKDYIQEPTPCDPCINRFWPIFSLTFNDCEVEPGTKVHIYPPSDVELLKHPQKEWNRARQALREHRNENAPFYVTRAGWLTDEGPDSDLMKLKNHESGEVIQLQGNPPDGDISKALAAFRPAPIDQNVYATSIYQEDATLVVGTNQPQEPPHGKQAATPAVIQEQARISGTNSNVDDLDDLLSELARAAGEMMLREFSKQTVTRIVGRGAVWPEQNREDFLNEIFLDIVASSSGRPNKAVEIANFERVAPMLLQAGSNPWGVIKEAVKRLDDRLDVADFAPVQPPSPVPAAKPQGQSPHVAPIGGGQPLIPNAASQPVPMPSGPPARV